MWFLLILDQILSIFNLKKDRKVYFRSDSTVIRSNATCLDQILFIFNENSMIKLIILKKIAILDEKYILDEILLILNQILNLDQNLIRSKGLKISFQNPNFFLYVIK